MAEILPTLRETGNTTRRQALLTLKRAGELTAEQLGRELGVSAVAARRHLETLQAEGLVSVRLARRSRGRPAHVYSLTSQGDDCFPRSYHTFVSAILEDVHALFGKEGLKAVLDRRRQRLYEVYAPRLHGKSLADRVAELTRIQDENGYMADWQRLGDYYRLYEHNCPLASAACDNPELCQMELALIQDLVGAPVILEDHRLEGCHGCAFLIGPVPGHAD